MGNIIQPKQINLSISGSFTGSFASGLATLVNGAKIVSNSTITANSFVFLTINKIGVLANTSTVYEDSINRIPGVSFTIKSLNVLDTSDIAWLIVESTSPTGSLPSNAILWDNNAPLLWDSQDYILWS